MAGRADCDPRTVLERLLREQDRTYEEIAGDFEKLAHKLGEHGVSITARHLRRLASGERVGTTPSTRRVLQALFGLTIEELLKPCARETSSALTIVTRPSQLSNLELLTMATERSRNFSLRQRVVTSTEGIDLLTDEVRDLALMYLRLPMPELLGRLVQAQDEILTSLELRQKPTNARQLYFLATIVGGMFAFAASDAGNPQIALASARTAFLSSEYADHNGLRAWIRGIQSNICYWYNQPHEAIRYAQASAELETQTRSAAIAWLYANEARAWAALGNAEKTMALVERAERAYDHVEQDDLHSFGGICMFGQPKLLYFSARALAALPEHPSVAENYSVQAIDAYQDMNQPDWDYSCEADSRISLALARATHGELDGVLEPLQPVLALPPEQRINDLVKSISLVHHSINKFGPSAEARRAQEDIEAFIRTSLPQFPI